MFNKDLNDMVLTHGWVPACPPARYITAGRAFSLMSTVKQVIAEIAEDQKQLQNFQEDRQTDTPLKAAWILF